MGWTSFLTYEPRRTRNPHRYLHAVCRTLHCDRNCAPATTRRLSLDHCKSDDLGQAPGARVHASGIPFDDPSGDRLRDWLGIDRDTFYDRSRLAIVPMAFCFPGYDKKGSDLPPPKICAQTWRTDLMAAMPQVELTLMIGQYAQAWHMKSQRKKSLTETVRAWREYGPSVLPLPHPSWRNTGWLKKNPWFAEEILPWLRAEISRLV